MSKSALASLTAQYTDSENEEDGSLDSQNSQSSQVIIPKPTPPPAATPDKPSTSTNSRSRKRTRKSVRRLVSYQDDTIISDEEEQYFTESSEESDSDEETYADGVGAASNNTAHYNQKDNGATTAAAIQIDDESSVSMNELKASNKNEKSSKYAHYGFTLPPEPKGKPSSELVEKVRNLYEKMDSNNMDMNRLIQGRKEFRNPSIYEKLIQFCDINEFGTNYPPEMYDPLQWGPESYYEELARVQKNEMVKRQKDRKDTDKIEQATALARKVEEEAKKRKSKWDQPAAPVKPVVPTALTTTVTGTKGTVISAFGTLPKKPAV